MTDESIEACTCGQPLICRRDLETGWNEWQHGDNPEAKYREPIIRMHPEITDWLAQYKAYEAWLARVHAYESVAARS